MILYIARRLAAGAVVFLTVTALCYTLFYMRGSRAIAIRILGDSATEQQLDAKAEALGLDRPLPIQYWDWLTGLVTGDLGRSYVTNLPVADSLATRIPVTVSLILVTLILLFGFAVVLGVAAASRGGLLDRVVQGISVLLGAIPNYLLALIMVIIFGLTLRLVPATGFIPITESFTGWFSTVIIPSVSIALGSAFLLAVWIRSFIIDLRRQDWVRTLRSRGISERAIMYRHVLRNAAAPTVQVLGLNIIGLITGTIVVERIFALPGIGAMTINSGSSGDIPVMLGAVTVLVVVVVLVNLAVDISIGFLNPKVRTS